MYRCCVIFIALLHLLGGISFSVNNQVNCTQTRSGTPANFFIVTLSQAIFFSPHPPPPKKLYFFLHPPNPMSPASPPQTLPASVKEGFMVPRKESGRVVCSKVVVLPLKRLYVRLHSSVFTWEGGETPILVYLLTTAVTAHNTQAETA